MSTYPQAALDALAKKRTPFIALEGTVTFYKMSDYAPGQLRSAMTPVGTYLFWQGFNVEDVHNYLPFLQAFGSKSKNLTAAESVESSVTVNSVMLQVGDDATWFAAGHPPLMCYVDFIFDPGFLATNQKDDIKNANNLINQTVVVKDLSCTKSSIAGSDANLVTWNLNFTGGEVVYLSPTTMDLP